tara:strand:- start:513 stop:1052 length:540 start_codon:yes stop_codon:yes gene_type:complete
MSAIDEYLERLNLEDLIDDSYRITLDNKHFQGIKFIDIIVIYVDNSIVAISEHDGSDQIKIIYDIRNNQILPYSNPYYHESKGTKDDKYPVKMQTYTESDFCSINEAHHDNQSFDGDWLVSDLLFGWESTFHGKLDNTWGELSEENQNILNNEVNTQSLYLFLKEVLLKITASSVIHNN